MHSYKHKLEINDCQLPVKVNAKSPTDNKVLREDNYQAFVTSMGVQRLSRTALKKYRDALVSNRRV